MTLRDMSLAQIRKVVHTRMASYIHDVTIVYDGRKKEPKKRETSVKDYLSDLDKTFIQLLEARGFTPELIRVVVKVIENAYLRGKLAERNRMLELLKNPKGGCNDEG